jgi:hypothetical protein
MKQGHFFDKPQNVKKVLMGFYIFLGLLIVADFILPKHPFFPWEGYPSFYAAYGFVAYVIIVFGSNYILRKLFGRNEDYYD